jgi:hypothetical protein
MIKPHTAQSLGKYLGKRVWLTERKHAATLIKLSVKSDFVGVEWEAHNGNDFTDPETRKESILIKNVLPYLKDYTQLLAPMIHEGVEIISVRRIYGDYCSNDNLDTISESFEDIDIVEEYSGAGGFTTEIIQKLQDLGFGAIKCEESPTGYRDLWNNTCKLDEGK